MKLVVFDNSARYDQVEDIYHETEDDIKTLCGRLVADGNVRDSDEETQPNCGTCKRVRASRERRASHG